MNAGAIFSPDKKYRYALWRIWDKSIPSVLFIGLNPSTAGNKSNDPTINKCIGFAKKWKYGGLYIVNLFAFRTSDPRDLLRILDPVGPDNDKWIKSHTKDHKLIIATWGNYGSFMEKGREIYNEVPNLYCLKINKTGQPAHPLYLGYDLKPKPFNYVVN